MSKAANVTVGWFEIQVSDMDRAIGFYGKVFNCDFTRMPMGDIEMAMFPWDFETGGAGGSLVKQSDGVPTMEGSTIYFSSEDVNIELARIEAAGGKILLPKTIITEEFGFMAFFADTEGNKIGLHSQK